jgi:hydroxymethylglutaryl-CoA synthase
VPRAARGYRHVARGTDGEDVLADEIGRQPRPEGFDDTDGYLAAIKAYTEALRETETYQSWYARVVEPTLDASREVGNWYTGSVHVARASGLLAAREEDADLAGAKLLVGSYGSGAQAEIHSETVREGWAAEIDAMNLEEQLRARYDLSFEEYEEIHDVHNHDAESEIEERTVPEAEFVFDGWGRMGERKYTYVE